MGAYEKKFLVRNGKYLTRGDKCISRERSKLFVILVDTTLAGSASDTMIIPTISSGHGGYDCTVDWGDGTTDTYTGTNPTISHTYAAGGEKTIKISGTFPRIYFNNTGDKAKLLSVLNWGNYGLGVADQQRAFRGCVNNTSIAEDWKLDEWLTEGTYMFYDNQLTFLPDNMTLVSLTEGTFMFGFNQLTSLPTGMTLSALTNGAFMFLENTINTTDYSELLVNIAANNVNTGVPFHGGSSKYNASGETARNQLTVNQSWSIADGGLEI